ncbi:PAS domain S-box protein [Ferruginibacter profundus]
MRFRLTTTKLLTSVIALVVLIFVAIVVLLLRQASLARSTVARVSHTQEVLFQTAKVLTTITDNETSSRGFVLTGQAAFLEPLEAAKKNIYRQIETLKVLTQNDAAQQQRIDSILFYTNKRILFSDSTVALRQQQGLDATIQLVSAGNGKKYMDNIRRFINAMQQSETAALEQQKLANEKAAVFLDRIIFTIIIISVFLIIVFLRKDALHIAAQKKAEETLKKNEEYFHLLTSNIKDYAISMLDTNGKVIGWSSGAEDIKGYKEAEIIGRSFEIFYTKEDIAKGIPQHNLEMARQNGHYESEGWRLRKSGSRFWADVIFTALKDETGKLYGYSKITRDITEKRNEREELEFLNLQIKQSNDAIYTLDANRKIKSWNHGAEYLYGFTKEEALGREPNELLKTDISHEEINTAIKEISRQNYWIGELKRKAKSGKVIYVHASTSTIKDGNGTLTGYVSVSYDITAQKELREQVNHLASMVEESSEAIFSRGLDQRIISWNRGAEKLFGYTKAEAIGKTAEALGITKITRERIAAIEQQILQKGTWRSERDFFHKSGYSFFGAISGNVTRNEKGEIVSYYFIVKDINVRKQLEEQLKQSNEELEEKVKERSLQIYNNEKRYRYLFENNPLPMWVIDLETFSFLDVNEMATLHYGYSREEFLSMKATDIRPEAERENFIQADHAYEIDPFNYNRGIWNHRKKDGTIIQVEIIAHKIMFEGRPARFILSNDVTEKKIVEEKLISSEKRFRMLIENNYDIITLMDASFNVIYRSPSTFRITGWSNEEMINNRGTKNIHPDDIEYFNGVIREIMAHPDKPVNTSFRSRHKDGHYLRLEGTLTNLLHQEHVKAIVFNSRDVTERIETEEKLANSELRFRSLIENSVEGISLLDEKSNVIYRSPSALKIIGNNPKTNTISYAHPDDLENFKNKFAETLSKPGVPVPYRVKYLHADGHHFWSEGTFTNLLHIKGVNAIVANYHDVTEKIEAEEKLESSEKRFRALVENNKDVIMLLDASFNVTYRSPSATAVNGWTDEDVKTMSGIQNIHPDDMNYANGVINNMMNNPGKPYNVIFRNRHKNGNFRWLEGVVTNLLQDKNVNAILFNFRDVTERIEAEEKLKASEEQFRHSMDNMLEGVQIIGFDWKYIYVNNAMAKHGKYAKEELLGHTVMEKYPGIEQAEIYKVYLKCFNERVPIHLENEFVFPDGSSAWFELSFLPVPEGIFILSIDITERKQAEEGIKKLNTELEERVNKRTAELKKANEELEAFSYSVSHDLRAPLRAIIGYSQILEEDYSSKLDDEAKRITGVIKANTARMGTLIDDLLTFSRMGRHEIAKAPVNSVEMVDEIIKGMSSNGGGNVSWSVHTLPEVKADHNMLRQVWINLISNAIKYSATNQTPKIHIGSFKHNGQMVFFVEDNGVGFDEKYKNKLFKVFQRLHSAEEFEGTGIGLAIVEKIVSKHGGHVWAESELNKGASFYFSLPEN